MNIKDSKTLCVILHYGSQDYTDKCIESLVNEKKLDIIISDNDPSQSYEPPQNIREFVKIIKMPITQSAKKANRQNLKRKSRNDHFKAIYREARVAFEKAIKSSDAESARKIFFNEKKD